LFSVEAHKRLLTSLGAEELLLRGLRTHRHSTMAEAACAALVNLSMLAQSRAEILSHGGVDALTKALQLYPDSGELQYFAATVLGNLVVDNDKRPITPDNVDLLLCAMRTHADNEQVVLAAINALCNFTASEENRQHARRGREITECVRATTRSQQANPTVLAVSVALLANLSSEGGEIGEWVSLALSTLRTHRHNPELCTFLCRAIGTFAGMNREAVVGLGGLELVLETMKTHSSRPDVLTTATNAFSNLALGDVERDVGFGAISLLLGAMQSHPHHLPLQEAALSALVNLAQYADNRNLIVSGGGIALVLEAMKLHRNHEDLMYAATGTLHNLATDAGNRNSIVSGGGIEMVLEAMRLHPNHAHLMHAATETLKHLETNGPKDSNPRLE
jgi:hypothetical protein